MLVRVYFCVFFFDFMYLTIFRLDRAKSLKMSANESLMPNSEDGKTPQAYNVETGEVKFTKVSSIFYKGASKSFEKVLKNF